MSGPQPDRAAEFFQEVVEPTVQEFFADVASVRRGFLAAIVLSHMADHFFHSRSEAWTNFQSEKRLRAALSPAGSPFAFVCDVANAAKHMVLEIKPYHRPLMFSGSDDVVSAEPRANDSSIRANDGILRINSKAVFVVLPDGSRRALHPAVLDACRMWRRQLGLPDA